MVVFMGTLQMNACELRSTSTTYQVIISREVADFGLGLGHNGMVTFCGLTEHDLKHTAKYLLYQYRLHKENNHTLSDDTDPQKEWDTYVYNKVNGRELSVLTRTAFACFPNQQPIPHGLLKPWTTAIKENQYELGHLLGFFPYKDTDYLLGKRIWDAYAAEQKLPSAQELIQSSMGSASEIINTQEPNIPKDQSGLFSRTWSDFWGLSSPQNSNDIVDLDSDKERDDDNNKSSRWEWKTITSAISGRWAQMERGEKAVWIGIPAVVFFLWYRLSHRG